MRAYQMDTPWAELAATGVNVGERDLMMAASVLAKGCEVVSRYSRVLRSARSRGQQPVERALFIQGA